MKSILVWGVAISLFLLSPAIMDDKDGWREFRFGELLITLPAADGWEVTEEPDRILVTRRKERSGGQVAGFKALVIAEHPIPDQLHDWLDEEMAMAYREWEVRTLRDYADRPPRFELSDVEVGEVEINETLFFTLKFVRTSQAPKESGWALERQELHLVFPPDYAEKLLFYKLFFMDVCFTEPCYKAALDLSYLKQSLYTVRFKAQK